MKRRNWMIYGAYGYTGRLVAEEAVQRGHRPVLAGRSAAKLLPLAETLGLDSVVVDLQDEEELNKTVRGFDLVFHAAGPFVHTYAPMVRACLNVGTSYVDVAGEISVFEQVLTLMWSEPLQRKLFAFAPLHRIAQKLIEKNTQGPTEHLRRTERSQVWVWARNGAGVEKQVWLETSEAYHFTAVASVRCVEKVLIQDPQGALTPALAFGSDFVLEIPGTKRFDHLEDNLL